MENKNITTTLAPFSTYHFAGQDWLVLKVENDQALLLSELILEVRPYNEPPVETTWEECTLRHYLNNDFYNSLSANDRERVCETNNINKINPWFGTDGGNDTADKIFLLSVDEAVDYFGDSGQLKNRPNKYFINDEYNPKRAAKPKNRKISGRKDRAFWWWLRSPGYVNGLFAAGVGADGSICVNGLDVEFEGGIRPALWVKLQ